MLTTHPLSLIPTHRRAQVFVPLLAATLLLMVVLNVSGSPTTAAAPLGIVSLELAGSVAKAQAILASWDGSAKLHAAFGLGLDYLYMPLYSTTIGLACLGASDMLHRQRWPASQIGAALAWAMWLAAFCDAVENIALTAMMFGGVAAPWPELSFWCASIKFVLIAVGLAYTAYGLGAALSNKWARAT